ncbi:hypothetical protein B0T20DRAFT_406296 [Sordaria brevicollis]|uniref:Uncharacterized protein n=1 Tax=Sordaria brevicollis TaxID=83679 RepID=A0AAE0UEV2_SORBR|nr:hypothetical protein B0T20DRAFT_406296 [Sordaria brevicollis]
MSLPSEDHQPPSGEVTSHETPSSAAPVDIKPSAEALRLFWSLHEPLNTENTISVLQPRPNPYGNPIVTIRQLCGDLNGPREPYFRGTNINNNDGNEESSSEWYPISKFPVSNPKVSELKVLVGTLRLWQGHWTDYYEPHAEDTEDPSTLMKMKT